ncbi:MAG: hypothetical protein ACOY4T_08395 [Pseudomonadota bacterium]
MVGPSKILTVSYGTFSCTLEGFDDPFSTMKAIAEYFRDLAAEDRYFGAEPPQPDAEMLSRIAEREIQHRVEAKVGDAGIVLRQTEDAAPSVPALPRGPVAMASAAPAVGHAAVPAPAPAPEESVAAKLMRIRAAVAAARIAPVATAAQPAAQPAATPYDEEETVLPAADAPMPFGPPAGAGAGLAVIPGIDTGAAPETEPETTPETAAAGEVAEAGAAEAASGGPAAKADPLSAGEETAWTALAAPPGPGPADEAGPVAAGDHEDAQVPAGAPAHAPAHAPAGPDGEVAEEPVAETADEIQDGTVDLGSVLAKVADAAADTEVHPGSDLGAEPALGPAAAPADMYDEDEDEDDTSAQSFLSRLASRAEAETGRTAVPGGGETGDEGGAQARDVPDDAVIAVIRETVEAAPPAAPEAAPEAEVGPHADGRFARGAPEVTADTSAEADEVDDEAALIAALAAEARDAGHMGVVPDEGAATGEPAPAPAGDDGDGAEGREAGPPEAEAAAGNAPKGLIGRARARVIKVRKGLTEGLAGGGTAEAPAPLILGEADKAATDEPAATRGPVLAGIEAALGDTGLSDDDEADLLRQLAEAARDDADRRDPHEGRDILTEAARDEAASVERLMEEANSKLEGAESRRRFSAIAHLKAAVAATVADRKLKLKEPASDPRPVDEGMDLYRDDLSKAVRPRRPAAESSTVTRRPQVESRPAPLILVSELRVDRPASEVIRESAVVRPRRISAGNLALSEGDEDMETEPEAPLSPAEARSFAEFAGRLGAASLPDLLEAAAVYTATVEGLPHFSRPHVLRKVASATDEADFNREDGLRSFGLLLRQGKIQKVRRGQFAVTESSRFMTEARSAAR